MPNRRSKRRRREWVTETISGQPELTPRNYYEICCDCGLVHKVSIKKHRTKPRTLVVTSTVEDDMTTKWRKKYGIKIIREVE